MTHSEADRFHQIVDQLTRERDEARDEAANARIELAFTRRERDEKRIIARLVRALEFYYREDDEGEAHPDTWDAYEAGREAIACPVVIFPGGPEGEHFHYSDDDGDCYLCAQEAEEEMGTQTAQEEAENPDPRHGKGPNLP